ALDNWALALMDGRSGPEKWLRLLELASAADPEPDKWRLAFREALAKGAEKSELQKLATKATADKTGATTFWLSGEYLVRRGAAESAIVLLAAGQERFPADFWLNHTLAMALGNVSRWEEAKGFLRAALSLRPQSPIAHLNVGVALANTGKHDEAIR